ncbi:hypothetical protein [Colwellia sp. E150_009]|jgi:hypothetical protein
MEQKQRIALSNIMSELYQKPEMIEEQWHIVSPMLTELIDTTPQGFEGVTSMINKHFTNAAKFSDVKIQKFELESGLIKLNVYFQKLNAFKR